MNSQDSGDQHSTRKPGSPVPLIDHVEGRRVYDNSILRLGLLFGIAGAIVFGWMGYALASGAVAIAGLGQWASAGNGPGTLAGASLGAAACGLTGALISLYRMPAREMKHEHQEHSS
jgi:hypothetical protein